MAKHFDKILIANRGEIACRIIRTCRRLGIGTVAVFSEADARSRHVSMADEAVFIGPSPAEKSYLNVDALVSACKETHAQAVHPGCGFLSEEPLFAERLEKENVAFVGPSPSVLRLMGDKLKAKDMARQAGLPIIPGTVGPLDGADHVRAFARDVGYPVLIKACAGGGGKGIRLVHNDDSCDALYAMCRDEAQQFFGNSELMAEKALDAAHHVEIQVLADQQGNIVCFPERECSIQRRNQKIIEESPSPLFNAHPHLRRRAIDYSRAIAQASGYVSAGTVEFLVASHSQEMFFLEVNPRLQVEHTVTEMVSGVDLVEQMLRVAADMPITVMQSSVAPARGHATEVRILAEDPGHGHAASTGRIHEYAEPLPLCGAECPDLRIDSGVHAGSSVSLYYDSLLCKVCTWGHSRSESVQRMRASLDALVLRGVEHNTGLAHRVLSSETYLHGDADTTFLDAHLKSNDLFLSHEDRRLVCVLMACVRHSQMADLFTAAARDPPSTESVYGVSVCGESGPRKSLATPLFITVCPATHGWRTCTPAGSGPVDVQLRFHTDSPLVTAAIRTDRPGSAGGQEETVTFQYYGSCDDIHHTVVFHGLSCTVTVCTPLQQTLLASHALLSGPTTFGDPSESLTVSTVRAPMPSLVVDVRVRVGDLVRSGEEVATIEAMKMRSKICAPTNGRVTEVCVSRGSTVQRDDVVLTILPS